MPATTTRTDDHPERGLPDREWDYKRSHLRAQITTRGYGAYSLKGGATYRRSPGGWTRLHPVRVPDLKVIEGFDTRFGLSEHVEALNAVCARIYQAQKQQRAQRKADRLDRRRRKEAAQEEYREWLNSLPIGGADAYKEDPDRWIYPGGLDQNGRGRAREMSTARWLQRKAHKHYPDEAKNVAAEIRGKYDLHSGISLV